MQCCIFKCNVSYAYVLTIYFKIVIICMIECNVSVLIWKRELSNIILTLNVRGPSNLGSTISISWLLIPWLLASPGHQEP